MRTGGVLTLATRHVDHTVRISVSDTGEGIPADRQETIFRPFFTTKHQGTGLGLAITRGIVERHGGRLEVESMPGAGSTFTLVLAVPPQPDPAP
jgi:signal transduction histidine kinase